MLKGLVDQLQGHINDHKERTKQAGNKHKQYEEEIDRLNQLIAQL